MRLAIRLTRASLAGLVVPFIWEGQQQPQKNTSYCTNQEICGAPLCPVRFEVQQHEDYAAALSWSTYRRIRILTAYLKITDIASSSRAELNSTTHEA